VKFRDLKRLLSKFGVEWDERRGKGSHGAFAGYSHVTKIKASFTLPANQQRDVSKAYLNPLRRKFELTAGDGVSDDLFV